MSLSTLKNTNLPFFKEVNYSDQEFFPAYLKEQLDSYKLIHLSRVPETIDLFDYYQQLNASLGKLIRKGEDLEHLKGFKNDQWLDVRYDEAHSHTFRHSNTRQPFHTDGAYITDFEFEVVFLFCKEQAKEGGETIFIEADQLVELLKEKAPDLLDQLMVEEVIFGKGDFGVKREKIISNDEKGWLLNWNYFRVAPENSQRIKEMAEAFHCFLESEVFHKKRYMSVRLKPGDCVYFFDRRVLHGRTAFQGNRCLIKGALKL